jgi:hypothetical protein
MPLRRKDKEAADMMRWSRFTVVVVICMMVLAGMPRGVRAQTADNWGFETGTMAGWTTPEGIAQATAADEFAAPYWGQYMAVLGQRLLRVVDLTGMNVGSRKNATSFSLSSSTSKRALQGARPSIPGPPPFTTRNTIRREFTANMTHLVLAYNIFADNMARGFVESSVGAFGRLSYTISLLGDGTIIDEWSTTPAVSNADVGIMTLVPILDPIDQTGWLQVESIDLSPYLYRQLVVEVSFEYAAVPAESERVTLGTWYRPTWAYVDINSEMPIVRPDLMPEVHFIVPTAPGTTVTGTSIDVVIEASDDQAIAEVRLLVNGVLAGQSMVSGRQTFHVSLQEGLNTLQAIAMDGSGKQAVATMTVRADSRGPIVTLDIPVPEKTTSKVLVVSGNVQDLGSGVRGLTVNGDAVATDATGAFSTTVRLQPGANEVVIEAVDNVGNITSETFAVTCRSSTSAPSSTYVVLTIGSMDMEVNGMTRKLDAAPFIKDGRTLLPIRALIEALGGSVQWNASTKTATVMLGSRTVALTIGSTTALVNGKAITLDVAPMIVKGRTFLPLRALAESLGLDLAWEPVSQTISFTYWP